jgi:hypothetical protein
MERRREAWHFLKKQLPAFLAFSAYPEYFGQARCTIQADGNHGADIIEVVAAVVSGLSQLHLTP